jgi:hypothetical protein
MTIPSKSVAWWTLGPMSKQPSNLLVRNGNNGLTA